MTVIEPKKIQKTKNFTLKRTQDQNVNKTKASWITVNLSVIFHQHHSVITIYLRREEKQTNKIKII